MGTTVKIPQSSEAPERRADISNSIHFFVPVRNLLWPNKDADGRRFEIFQVRLGG